MESLEEDCVSLSFWFKDKSIISKESHLPLSAAQNLATRRNIEKLAGQVKLDIILFSLLSCTARKALLSDALLQVVGPANVSQALWAVINEDFASLPQIQSLHEQVYNLLSQVMPQSLISPWLRELVAGRYD